MRLQKASNQALQLTVKSVAPFVAQLFTASELGRYVYRVPIIYRPFFTQVGGFTI